MLIYVKNVYQTFYALLTSNNFSIFVWIINLFKIDTWPTCTVFFIKFKLKYYLIQVLFITLLRYKPDLTCGMIFETIQQLGQQNQGFEFVTLLI